MTWTLGPHISITGGGASSGTSEIWFRITNGTGSSATKPGVSSNSFNWACPFAGRVIKATAFLVATPGSTTCNVYKDFEGTASITATFPSFTSSAGGFVSTVTFPYTATFARDTVLNLSINPTTDPTGGSIVLVVRPEDI